MSTGSEHRRETIKGALLRVAGPRPNAQMLAEASVGTWQRVAAQLVPVIGEGGVEALYSRSLHLQRIAHHEHDAATVPHSPATPFQAVRLSLERRDAVEALETSVALLEAFFSLLSTLIGDALTERLLSPVWADRRTDEPAQETQP